jgi:hypothetical protein
MFVNFPINWRNSLIENDHATGLILDSHSTMWIEASRAVQNDKGMEQMLTGKFQLGSDASVAACPVDRHASSDTDWKMMNAEILLYLGRRAYLPDLP